MTKTTTLFDRIWIYVLCLLSVVAGSLLIGTLISHVMGLRSPSGEWRKGYSEAIANIVDTAEQEDTTISLCASKKCVSLKRIILNTEWIREKEAYNPSIYEDLNLYGGRYEEFKQYPCTLNKAN